MLFRSLFELADDVIAVSRSLNPETVPEGARLPEPEKWSIEGGTMWAFGLGDSGIDDQIRPSIAISDSAAVFSLAPAQAGRMLVAKKQTTGAPLSAFDGPLATSAALDVAGLVDLVEPWILYAVRVGVLQQRNGFVDGSTVIGPDIDDGQVKDIVETTGVLLDALRCIRLAVAETTTRSDATVTHWRNMIRDLPAK